MSNGFTYLASAELTDVGRRRKNNEDAVLRLPEHGVFCVADGMGGVQGGEVASKATVDALRQTFTESPDAPYALTAIASSRLVARALNRASQWIKAHAEERGLTGAGSTVVAIAFDQVSPAAALILHAGDSRAYRLRADKLVQLSADHSVAAAAGLADDKDLPAMFRGVITRAVGLENTVLLEETPTDVQAGDLFLLCSDGLSKMVSDKHLHKLLHKHADEDLQALAQLLVDEALKAGGEDNVSVVLVRVAKTLPPAPTMEVPPQTLALEVPDSLPPASDLRPPTSPYPDDAPTQETGQTVDTADGDKTEDGPRERQTPLTPPSGEGTTPVTAPRPLTSDLRPPTSDLSSPPRPPATPSPNSSLLTPNSSLLVLLLLAALLAVAAFALYKYYGGASGSPTSDFRPLTSDLSPHSPTNALTN